MQKEKMKEIKGINQDDQETLFLNDRALSLTKNRLTVYMILFLETPNI